VDVARQLYKLFCQVGFPKIIQSDNGPEFRAGTAKELAQLVQADQRFSTPYHPQGNGMAEAFVKKAKRALLKEAQGACYSIQKKSEETSFVQTLFF
jgi:transposase InsO family protein